MIGDPSVLTSKERRAVLGIMGMCIFLALFMISALEFKDSGVTYTLLIGFMISGVVTIWSLMGYTKLQTRNITN